VLFWVLVFWLLNDVIEMMLLVGFCFGGLVSDDELLLLLLFVV